MVCLRDSIWKFGLATKENQPKETKRKGGGPKTLAAFSVLALTLTLPQQGEKPNELWWII